MKKTLSLLTILSVSALSAQNFNRQAALFANSNPILGLTATFENADFKVDFTKYDFSERPFSIYNPTTMVNDNYTTGSGKYQYKNSGFLFNNNLYGRTDSLNPNGATNIQSVLVMGTINSLLRKF